MYGQFVLYEKEDAVGIVTLNRPDRLNAMGSAMREELAAVLEEINRDETRVTVFAGSGRAFCAGADIKELDGPGATPIEGAFVVLRHVAEAPKVCIAAVQGVALGAGCELALACDLRVAGDTAQFGLPEVKLGLLPGAGGSQWMPRAVGASRAKVDDDDGRFHRCSDGAAVGTCQPGRPRRLRAGGDEGTGPSTGGPAGPVPDPDQERC